MSVQTEDLPVNVTQTTQMLRAQVLTRTTLPKQQPAMHKECKVFAGPLQKLRKKK